MPARRFLGPAGRRHRRFCPRVAPSTKSAPTRRSRPRALIADEFGQRHPGAGFGRSEAFSIRLGCWLFQDLEVFGVAHLLGQVIHS